MITHPIQGDPTSVRFLVFGDWGGIPFYPYSTVIQRRTAKRMASFASRKEVQFILALGDNFYFTGVRDVDDRRFQASVFRAFILLSLLEIFGHR